MLFECKNNIIEAGKFFLLLVQGLDQMAPVPFQVAEACLIIGQGPYSAWHSGVQPASRSSSCIVFAPFLS